MTAEQSAVQANNLKKLLKKGVFEYKNAYRVMSSIDSKGEKRIRELTDNRYIY